MYEGPTVTDEVSFEVTFDYDKKFLNRWKEIVRIITFSLRVFATLLSIRLQAKSNPEPGFGGIESVQVVQNAFPLSRGASEYLERPLV